VAHNDQAGQEPRREQPEHRLAVHCTESKPSSHRDLEVMGRRGPAPKGQGSTAAQAAKPCGPPAR
jgi:hypothetical protein